jgi:hypothetical protein
MEILGRKQALPVMCMKNVRLLIKFLSTPQKVPYTAGSSIRKFLLGQYLSPFTTEVVACLLPHTIALSSWSSPTYRRPCPHRPLSPHLCSCSSECSCHQDLGVTRSSTSPQRFLVLIHCDLIENK